MKANARWRLFQKLAKAVCLAVLVAAFCSETSLGHRVLRDMVYADVDGHTLLLDLYLPDPVPQTMVPLVVWVHGGGWRNGSKDDTYAPPTLGEAYAVASINYRLSGVAVFPAQIHDVKAAVRWLRAHAEQYGFDPERFGAWGASAGGHLVALLGVSCGHPDLEGTVGEHLDQSSCVQAVCDFFGPTDFFTLVEQRGLGENRRIMAEDLLLGGRVEALPELASLASPSSHVHAQAPPFLILHGSEDPVVPVGQSIGFASALQGAGGRVELVIVDGAGHGFSRDHLVHVKPFFDLWLRKAE